MTMVEAEGSIEVDGVWAMHPERTYGLIDPEKIADYTLDEANKVTFDLLNTLPIGAEVSLDGKTYALVHHVENGNQVTSLTRTEARHRIVGGISIFTNHSFSLILRMDGLLVGEDHTSRDVLRPGAELPQQVEDLSSVKPLDAAGLALFEAFAPAYEEKREVELHQD